MKGDLRNPHSVSMELTEQQVWKGLYIGSLRRCAGIFKHKKFADQKGTESEAYLNDAMGGISENAVAIKYNIPWSGGGDFIKDHRYDVGPYQVRSSYWFNGRLLYHLEGRGKDYPGDVYIFVTCSELPTVMFRGWAWGQEVLDANDIQELQPNRPCYTLPQVQLHDMATLPSVETLTQT